MKAYLAVGDVVRQRARDSARLGVGHVQDDLVGNAELLGEPDYALRARAEHVVDREVWHDGGDD